MMQYHKRIGLATLETFFTNHSYMLVCQYNNLDAGGVRELRGHVATRAGGQLLMVKNTVMARFFAQRMNGEFIHNSLFQGPTLVLGCNSAADFVSLWRITTNAPQILCVGGLVKNTILTHLDLQKFVQLDYNVYGEFVTALQPAAALCSVLHDQPLVFQLNGVIHELWTCLVQVKTHKQNLELAQ